MRWRRGGRPAVNRRASFPTPPVTANAAHRPLPPPPARTATGLLTACRASTTVAPVTSSPVRPRMGDVWDWLAPGACGLHIPAARRSPAAGLPPALPVVCAGKGRGRGPPPWQSTPDNPRRGPAGRRRGGGIGSAGRLDHGCCAQASVNAEGRVQVHLFPSDSPIPEVLIAGSW
ncbi:unnamed protein product [Urochloa humidicola]